MANNSIGNTTPNTASSHHPAPTHTGASQSPYGMNDNVRTAVDGAGLSGAAGLAMAILQGLLASYQYTIARDYYNTNKKDFDFYKNTYQAKLVQHATKAFTDPYYQVDYPGVEGRALTATATFDDKWFNTRRKMHRYAIGAQRYVDYVFYIDRYRAAFAAYFAGRRTEDTYKDLKDGQWQNHKIQALNYGIAAGNTARQGLASATSSLTGAIDKLGSRVGGISSGLGEFKGYREMKNAASKDLWGSSASGAGLAPHTMLAGENQ